MKPRAAPADSRYPSRGRGAPPRGRNDGARSRARDEVVPGTSIQAGEAPATYPNRTPSLGQRVAGVEGSAHASSTVSNTAGRTAGTRRQHRTGDQGASVIGRRGSGEGGPPTPSAAAKRRSSSLEVPGDAASVEGDVALVHLAAAARELWRAQRARGAMDRAKAFERAARQFRKAQLAAGRAELVTLERARGEAAAASPRRETRT